MQVPTQMDQEIAYLQRRHKEGVPFNSPLIQELTAIKERYIANKQFLELELQKQIEAIEEIWNDLEFTPEIVAQVENLKNMAQNLLNQQQEKQQAIDIAIERLKIEKNDCVDLSMKLSRMQKKCDSMPKNPYFGIMKSFAERGNYRMVTGSEPSGDFREVG